MGWGMAKTCYNQLITYYSDISYCFDNESTKHTDDWKNQQETGRF